MHVNRNASEEFYTIGHSTRTEEEWLALLTHYRVACLVDVRTVPKSRRVPHFNKEHLSSLLPKHGMEYRHYPALGGLRKSNDPHSPNRGWRNASFRGYADYMQTEGFEKALESLLSEMRGRRTALMCAEAVPWRCHRMLLSDALSVRGLSVCHILSSTGVKPHSITSFAKVEGKRIIYPLLLRDSLHCFRPAE
ncbi:MAG: DUF488 domain-containing protein [Candidatus Manganitrophus sp.]|nr:DUF488 domain-containing protein [Candidatus Manganitrophus sp.]WDT71406.1 MAG: DUF488 domain-containing protein [Candidatus Manganitrophus sp.]